MTVADEDAAPLAVSAGRADLASVMDWRPEPSGLSDSVETCVGAGWHVSVAAGHGDLVAADEGELSRLRAALLDHVQARVGLVSVVHGLPAGLLEADRLW